MIWEQITFREALLWAKNRQFIEAPQTNPNLIYPKGAMNPEFEYFADGSILCISSDYSEYESGIITEPPLFWRTDGK